MMRHWLTYISSILCITLLSSCFTGIESTPRINADDVDQEDIKLTAEQIFLAGIKPQSFGEWQRGKKFYVTNDKLMLVMSGADMTQNNLAGTEIMYMSCDTVRSVTGDYATELSFSACDGKIYNYRIDASPSRLAEKESVSIPFTIEKTVVDTVREKLVGIEVYILTPSWYNLEDKAIVGRKFVKVTIESVDYGNDVYPIKVTFIDDRGVKSRVYMSLSDKNSVRDFATLFSFANPRDKYPSISDVTWENIINSRVALDMTTGECRLALGAPKEVERVPTYGGVQERWIYENGTYLIFEDGLLRQFRK